MREREFARILMSEGLVLAMAPVSSVAERCWYAMRTRSRHEKRVHDHLLGRTIETFLPLVERWSLWKDRRQRVAFPLFPTYCFARFSSTERRAVLTAPGVVEIVGSHGQPEPILDTEIENLQRLLASDLQYDRHPFFSEGREVEVVRGPLKGMRGRLLRKDRSTRLVLGVTLIHQAAIVEIHPADVAAV